MTPPAGALALLSLALSLAAPAPVQARSRHPVRGHPGAVTLDGQHTRVRWIDGDTFKVDSGPLAGASARLAGYNTLETYGPVHRIGAAAPEALLEVALAAAPRLAGTTWRCTSQGRRDAYGRLLVACPEAALALVRAGLAMVFALDGPPDPALLAAQREAQAGRAGLWAGGVPPAILTSVHAAGEAGLGARGPYDRAVDTRTGLASARPHQRRYGVCEEVCAGEGPARSCLVYVPYERRYRDRPACLGPAPAR